MIRTLLLLAFLFPSISILAAYEVDSSELSKIKFDKLEVMVASRVVHFKWDVNEEAKGARFIIEKSVDKINWKEVKKVESLGDHKERHTYQVSEINFAEGVKEYFRILRVDDSGAIEELDRIEINQPILTNMLVLPPQKKTASEIVVSYDSMISSKGVVYVKDEAGKIVYDKNLSFDEGYNRLALNLKKFQKGAYVVVLRDEFGNKITRGFNVYKKGRSKF